MGKAFLYGNGSGGSVAMNKSIIIVTAPAGSAVTCSMGSTTKTAAEKNGTWTFSGLGFGIWTVKATLDGQTATKSYTISRLEVVYVTLVYNQIPELSYTGEYEVVDDDDNPITTSQGNWKIRFLTSGTLAFTNLNGAENGIDVFLVGGGGRSAGSQSGSHYSAYGGERLIQTITLEPNMEYPIEIGAGSNDYGSAGGSTTGFNLTALGGYKSSQGTSGSGIIEFNDTDTGKLYGGTYSTTGNPPANTGMGTRNSGTSTWPGSAGIIIIRNAREVA